jgi:hypothetical protein
MTSSARNCIFRERSIGTTMSSDEIYLERIRSIKSFTRRSMEASRPGFSLPEYCHLIACIRAAAHFRGLCTRVQGNKSTYTGTHLLSSLVMQIIVGLSKHVVAMILEPSGPIVPIRSLVPRFDVHMEPDVGVRSHERAWTDARDGPYHEQICWHERQSGQKRKKSR